MARETVAYTGRDGEEYIITATPFKLDAPIRYSLDITIAREAGGKRHMKKFSAANTFDTEEEAIAHCFEFGRRIIDGKAPEFSGELP